MDSLAGGSLLKCKYLSSYFLPRDQSSPLTSYIFECHRFHDSQRENIGNRMPFKEINTDDFIIICHGTYCKRIGHLIAWHVVQGFWCVFSFGVQVSCGKCSFLFLPVGGKGKFTPPPNLLLSCLTFLKMFYSPF